jgi:hypothetical protein
VSGTGTQQPAAAACKHTRAWTVVAAHRHTQHMVADCTPVPA